MQDAFSLNLDMYQRCVSHSKYIPDIVPSGRFELGNNCFGMSASHSFTNFSYDKVPNVPISTNGLGSLFGC